MANEKRLTEKDKIAYYAIETFIKENGYPPTIRQLCQIVGKSTSTIHYRLKSLKQKGYITTIDGANRTIRLTKEVENAPTVDAVEVVHAEWACVNESDNVWMCTGKNGCGNEILLLEGTPTGNGWHYCPSCGAKMDGGNEDG